MWARTLASALANHLINCLRSRCHLALGFGRLCSLNDKSRKFDHDRDNRTNYSIYALPTLQQNSTCISSTLPPTTLRSSTSTSPTKPKAPNPPGERISHSINRTLWTPQTNLTLPIRNIKQLDGSAGPQPVATAVVLRVLRENETP
jgi:hypothetical protein